MSSSLFWEPTKRDGVKTLPYALKAVLRKRYGDSLINGVVFTWQAGANYFEALADAGVEGAADVLEALEKHESIEIKEVY